jgi:hypothetical protein
MDITPGNSSSESSSAITEQISAARPEALTSDEGAASSFTGHPSQDGDILERISVGFVAKGPNFDVQYSHLRQIDPNSDDDSAIAGFSDMYDGDFCLMLHLRKVDQVRFQVNLPWM